LGQLLNVQVEVQGAFALFDRIFEYLDLPIEIADRPNAVALDPAKVEGQVWFEHVSFRYDAGSSYQLRATSLDGRERDSETAAGPVADAEEAEREAQSLKPEAFALADVDFEAATGQLVALVGPSGAGKTTISMLVPRLYDVDEGAVRIDGIDVRDITLESLG